MAIKISLIVTVFTVIAYFHMRTTLETESVVKLQEYIQERGIRETQTFTLAESNLQTMKERLLHRLGASPTLSKRELEEKWAKVATKRDDGTWRDNFTLEQTHHTVGLFHGRQEPLTEELKARLLLLQNFVQDYGHAYEKQFADTYITTPENSMAIFWPGVPWTKDAPADLDMRKEEYVSISLVENNPERKLRGIALKS